MDEAKKGHRPRLKDWSRDKFAFDKAHGGRAEEFEALASQCFRDEGSGKYARVARESSATLTPEDFVERYEKTNTPLLITGTVADEQWAASRRWTQARLKEDFRDRKFKCGEDDDGYKIKVTMRNFIKYMEHQSDDSPLYVFDSSFDDDYSAKRILEDYKVPKFFPTNPDQEDRGANSSSRASGGGGGGGCGGSDAMSKDSVGYHDLFSLVGERRRPPYRWLLLGPKRSGTCVHTDPLATSAWNTVISGRKLWVLFPPGVPKSVVKAKKQLKAGEDDEAINYFVDLIPRLRRDHPSLEMYLFVQGPGDTVFVPGGWWHAVLNLDDAVAVTQNFCSKANFPKVWRETRTGRKKMAVKWLKRLHVYHPELATMAEALNAEDGFTMPVPKDKGKDGKGGGKESSKGKSGGGDEDEDEDDEGEEEKGGMGDGGGHRGRKGAAAAEGEKGEKKTKNKRAKSASRSNSPARPERNNDGRKKHESARDTAEGGARLLGSGTGVGLGGGQCGYGGCDDDAGSSGVAGGRAVFPPDDTDDEAGGMDGGKSQQGSSSCMVSDDENDGESDGGDGGSGGGSVSDTRGKHKRSKLAEALGAVTLDHATDADRRSGSPP